MNIMDKIKTGKIDRPQKIVLYGVEGIGKSTFASHFPNPIFLDLEEGTAQLDVARVDGINSWSQLMELIKEINGYGQFGTLVIDTADWAEKLCIEHICAKYSKKGIEDFGYGSGYTYLVEEFSRLLELLNVTVANRMNVVLLAHAQIRKFEQPDEMGAYDRWELKLNKKTTKQTASIVKEWADAVLFANYKTIVMTTSDGKKKAQGGQQRIMYTEHAATWDAKNRWGLPAEVPFDYSSIADHVPDLANLAKQPAAAVKMPQPVPEPPKTVNQPGSTLPPHLAELKNLMDLQGVTEEELKKAVAKRGYYPLETPIEGYAEDFVKGVLIAAWPQIVEFIKSEIRVNKGE